MLNKFLLILCLMFPATGLCQEFDASKFQPVVVEEVQVEASLVDKFEEEAAARIKEMKEIAENFKEMSKKALDDIKKIKDQLTVSMPSPEEYVTRSEVESIVKDEVAKQVAVTIKDKETKDVREEVVQLKESDYVADLQSVKVPGYAGNFSVADGEVITHVDGVPVEYLGKNQYGLTSRSGNKLMLGQRIRNGWSVRVVQPNCRLVNGVWQCN